jgi:hypothetical protein
VTQPHFLIYFDDVPTNHAHEAVADDWGNVEALAMHTADSELRCDRIRIEKIGEVEFRTYLRDPTGNWYRKNV